MKKLIVSICTAFCLMAAPLTAMEWGGLFTNDTGISTPDFSEITFKQGNSLSLWVKAPIGESGLAFSGETVFKYTLEGGQFTPILDVPLLKVTGDLNVGGGILSLNAGRFYYVDSTSAVISQVVDGASVVYALPLVKVGGFIGYTGLLNELNTAMTVKSEKASKLYDMAYPYLPVGVTFELPALAGNQSIELDGYYMLDLGANKNNLCFANLVLSGPIANAVYYNLGTSFGFQNFKNMMNYSSLSFLIFPTEAISINAGASFGSGKQGLFEPFTSLSTTSVTAASKITPKLSFSYTTGDFYAGLNGDYVLAYEDSKYKSSAADVGVEVLYNLFSDFQVGLSVNAMLDLTPAKANNYDAKLNVSLAF